MTRRHRISSAAAAGVLSVVTIGAFAAPAASASSPTCFGKKPTAPVLTKNNKTLKGTKGNDVLIATGKNDKILGLDGKDRICGGAVKLADGGAGDDQIMITSGKATGGLGNDKLTQKSNKSGKVSFDGGPGTDTLTLSKKASAGSVADGGADADKITVPGSLLNVSVPHTSGDVLNGFVTDIQAPASGGPAFEAIINDTDLVGAPILVPGAGVDDDVTDFPSGDAIVLRNVNYAAGRTPGTWSVNFGDGDVRTGVGVPPARISHGYVGNATHAVSVTVTDNLGGTTTEAGTVTSDATETPSLSLGTPTVSATTTYTWPVTVATPPTGITYAPITSYLIDFGDGTQQVGTTPPATVTHTYPSQSQFTPRVAYGYTLLGQPKVNGLYPQTGVTVGTGGDPYLVIRVSESNRFGAGAQIVEPGQQVSVIADYEGPGGTTTIDPGLGGAPAKGTNASFSYPTAGTYTLTATVKVTGQPDRVATLPITVRDVPAVTLTGPTAAEEGPVPYTISAAVPAGARTYVYYPGHNDARPGTSFPPSITPILSPQDEEIYVSFANDLLPLNDTTSLQYDSDAYVDPQVTTRGLSLSGLNFYNGNTGSSNGAVYGPRVRDGIFIGSNVQGAVKTKIVSETLDLGNGTVKTASGEGVNRSPSPFEVSIPAAGDRQLVFTAMDTAGHKARSFGTYSAAGDLTVTGPTTTQTATGDSPYTLSGLTETVGANAKALSWAVYWDDGTPPAEGLGVLPSSLTHTYAAGDSGNTEDVTVAVRDDHNQLASTDVEVAVS